MKNFIHFLFLISTLLFATFQIKGQGRVEQSLLHFKARLVDTAPVSPDCGYFPFALGQKFEVLKSPASLKSRFIIILNPCPELRKVGLLKKGVEYSISASKINDKSFIVINDYVKEKLPTFWAEEIKLQSP